MLAIPSKNCDLPKTPWSKTLSKYVSSVYTPALASQHAASFVEIESHQKAIYAGANQPPKQLGVSSGDELRVMLVRYSRLLGAMEIRFDSDVGSRFVWRDAFKKVEKQGETDLRFERACCLFNLAAEISHTAIFQQRSQADGIKQAAAYFQQAAGILEMVELVVGRAPWAGRTTVDLAPSTLRALRTLCVAQAQRCFYEKAVADALGAKLLSGLAMQAAKLYSEALATFRAPPLAGHIAPIYADACSWNHDMYLGLAHFHAASEHGTAYEHGKQVARLEFATARLQASVAASASAGRELRAVYTGALERVQFTCEQAQKDNRTIYQDPVPPYSKLPPLDTRGIAKPAAPAELTSPLTQADDPFKLLVPADVKQQLARYDEQAQAVLESLYFKMEEASAEGDAVLRSADLPWSLQAVETGEDAEMAALPAKLTEELERLHAIGGVPALKASLTEVQRLAGECAGKVSEVETVLREEDARDAALAETHGERWTRLASHGGTAKVAADLGELRGRLALDAADTLSARFIEREAALAALDMPVDVLKAQIPHAAGSALAEQPCVARLRAALDALDGLRGPGGLREAYSSHALRLQGATRTVLLDRRRGGAGLTLVDRGPGMAGARIKALEPGGQSAAAGVHIGEVVVSVGGTRVTGHAQAIATYEAASGEVELLLHTARHEDSLVNAISYRGTTPAAGIIKEHLAKFEPLRAEADMFVAEHASRLAEVRAANGEFTQARINEVSSAARMDYFKSLGVATSTFTSLYDEASAAIGRLGGELHSLVELHERCMDLATAHLLEREDMEHQLEEQAAAAAAAAVPEAPPLAAAGPRVSICGSEADDDSGTDATLSPGTPAHAATAPAAAAAGGGAPPEAPELRAGLTELMQMGFSREQAEGALDNSDL